MRGPLVRHVPRHANRWGASCGDGGLGGALTHFPFNRRTCPVPSLAAGVYTVPSENLTAEILIAVVPLVCLTAVVAALALLLAHHRRHWAVAKRVVSAVAPNEDSEVAAGMVLPAQLQAQAAAGKMELRWAGCARGQGKAAARRKPGSSVPRGPHPGRKAGQPAVTHHDLSCHAHCSCVQV